jgi:DNA-binding MarR family transcriptional regulator
MIEGLFHPMPDNSNSLAVALFSEILTADQLVRNRLSKVLPKGMEISHFSVLNHLARSGSERTPAQLAKSFHVTRGAMTNTLGKLEWAGYIHIRPDWDDARRKMVAISPAGRRARDAALDAISPMIAELISELGDEKVRAAIPILRELRFKLEED